MFIIHRGFQTSINPYLANVEYRVSSY